MITDRQREQLEEIFARGLVSGIGTEEQTCLEGAIGLVMHGRLNSNPSCVADPDRTWGIVINFAKWSSPQARAEALLPVALAQIGTAGTDRARWVELVALGTARRVLPLALAAVGLVDHAKKCDMAARRNALHATTTAARLAEISYEYSARALYVTHRECLYRNVEASRFAAGSACHAVNALVAHEDGRYADSANQAAFACIEAANCAAIGETNYDTCDTNPNVVRDRVLREAVQVALDAYRAEGRYRD